MKSKSSIVWLFLLLGCTSFSDNGKEYIESSEEHDVIQNFKLGTRGTTLEIVKDDLENSIVLKTKRNNYLISVAGCGNCEVIKNKNGSVKLDTLTFTKEDTVYLITSYIRGSTYGAECYFIVFKKSEWKVMALPFDRARFYDLDNDGFDEIVEYKSLMDSAIHTFNSGLVFTK